jgi:hypothetical protein
MRVLIACEFSGIVRDAFAAKGHDAWSCDLLPTERPGNHIQGDVLEVLGQGWDLMVAFPPCTHLAVSGAAWFEEKRKDGRQQQGIDFFLALANADLPAIAVENPVGIMSKIYRKPDQVIHPYYFGDEARKKTCLWLKNLPCLYHVAAPNLFESVVTHVGQGADHEWVDGKTGKVKRMPLWYAQAKGFGGKAPLGIDHGKARSVTFPGIANAMAEQWG